MYILTWTTNYGTTLYFTGDKHQWAVTSDAGKATMMSAGEAAKKAISAELEDFEIKAA